MGTTEIEGERRLRLRLQGEAGGNLEELISESRAYLVRPLTTSPVPNLPSHQKGREVVGNERFVAQLLGHEAAEKLQHVTVRNCVVVGHSDIVRHEALLRLRVPDQDVEGTLDDIVRIQKGTFQPYRTELCSRLTESKAPPDVVLFNGARAFIDSYWTVRPTRSIVVLDPSEPLFEDALRGLQAEYAQQAIPNPAVQLPTVSKIKPTTFLTRKA
ncbi:MAG: hypothetical protein K6U87_03290 [Firmicutes bacterium]|nr:hypothetical protein [Bacillota bacterium]